MSVTLSKRYKDDIIKDLQWIHGCLQHMAINCKDIDEMHNLYSKAESVDKTIKLIRGE